MALGREGGAGDLGAPPWCGLQREARHSLTTSRCKMKRLCPWGGQGCCWGVTACPSPAHPPWLSTDSGVGRAPGTLSS